MAMISIHAPRAGSDHHRICHAPGIRDFNPRSPCGERRGWITPWTTCRPFQSTLPVRGATSSTTRTMQSLIFQSTLPVRGATKTRDQSRRRLRISIHAPRAGSDFQFTNYVLYKIISIHAPRAGSDNVGVRNWTGKDDFNPRSPCGERR